MSRSVVVRLSMEASQYIAQAQKAGEVGEDAMEKVGRAAKTSDQAIHDVGSTAGKVAAGGLAALFATGKAASDWESAWAGVTKTVEGTPEQLQAVEDGIRGLAKSMPATHAEIAGVAEAAGQLGVATGDVVDFTETMVQLGETTNVTAEDAATSIAQIQNVMRMDASDVDNFANALVDLGNKGASTEREILDMAARVAGAGTTIGASEQDVLALSAAMANLGIESELGGGAVQRVLTQINTDVKSGSADIAKYAEVAGVSSERFADAWGKRPVKAFDMLVQGLGKIQDNGGDVASVLGDMGIKGTQNLQVMLRLAGAGDGLTVALGQSGEAWAENSALVEEYGKRAETTDSQVTIAWNNIREAGIEAGEALLPMVASVSEAVAAATSWFANLSDTTQSAVTHAVIALTGSSGLVWATTRGVAAVQSLQASMVALGLATETTSKKMIVGKSAMFGAGGLVAGMSLMADESTTTGKAIETLGLTAGGALMGFAVGGPIGAAVGGGIGLIAGLGKSMLDSGEKAKETEPKVLDLAGAFDILSGSASTANREIAHVGLTQLMEEAPLLSQHMREVGISQRDMIDASLGNEKALERVSAAMKRANRRADDLYASGMFPDGAATDRAAAVVSDALERLGVSLKDVRRETIRNKLATGDWKKEFPGIPKEVLTEIGTRGIPESRNQILDLKKRYDLTPKQVQTLAKILGVDMVKNGLKGIRSEIDRTDGKTATVTTYMDTVHRSRNESYNAKRRGQDRVLQAEGSVLSFYADGDVRNGHVAQMAPAGAWRVWAEPETGGESYIPHAPSKRKRSLEIWAETGRILGADGFADGAVRTGRTGPAGSDWPRTLDESMRQLARQTDKTGNSLKGLKHRAEDLKDDLDKVREKRSSLNDATTSRFAVDLFGVDSAWGESGSAADRIRDTTSDLRDRIRLQRRLKKQGLSDDALAEVLAQGDNDDLRAILNTPGEAKKIQRLYRQYAKASERAGAGAGQLAYGAETREIVRELRKVREVLKQQRRDHRDGRRERTRDTDRQSRTITAGVTSGVNKAANAALQNTMRRTVSL